MSRVFVDACGDADGRRGFGGGAPGPTAAYRQWPREHAAGSSAAAGFRDAVAAQADVGWVGYAVPVVDGERSMCCFNSGTTWVNGSVVRSDGSACCGMCGLEPSAGGISTAPRVQPQPATPIKLEGSDQMVVLFRVVNKQVDRVRVFSEDCQLDAGGRDVVWLTGVRACREHRVAGIDRRGAAGAP